VFVVVGVTTKTGELELAADETVPFNATPGGVAVGEGGLVVITVLLVVGSVMSVADVVGELGGGVAVVLKERGGIMVPDTLGDVPGPTIPDGVVVVAAGGGGVGSGVEAVVSGVETGASGVEAVVVGALGGVSVVKIGGMIGEMMLERRLPRGVELVVAAAAGGSVVVGSGVTAGVVTPVEAAPVTPVGSVGVGVVVGVGRRALVNDSITPERGSVPGDEVAAGEGDEGEIAGSDVVATGSDVESTVAGKTAGSDVVAAGSDVVAAGSDVVATGSDVVATGSDVESTVAGKTAGSDVVATGSDVESTVAGKTAGSDVVAAGEGVGVGVGGSSKLDTIPLSVGNRPGGLGEGESEVVAAAAVAVDPPVPENVTPSVTGLLSLGVDEVVVVPPVKIPPGPKVIPLAAAEDGDGTLTVVGEALSGATGSEGVG
jgi:hypothetical protein